MRPTSSEDSPTTGWRVGVLGPLRVAHGETLLELNSRTQRTVLGLLALASPAPVLRDELIHTVWGTRAPIRATEMLQNHISRLRGRLTREDASDAPQILSTPAGGYQLRVESPWQVDLLIFNQLAAQAHHARTQDQPIEAAELYARCAGLWRGAPLADLPELRVHPLVSELTRRWQDIILEYSTIAAELGRHTELVPLLQQVAAADPLHELIHARLMAALAATGQRASALAVFDRLRRRLSDELGTSPGPELRTVHQQILRAVDDRKPAAAPSRPSGALHQLPTDIQDFTGRQRELQHLHRQVSEQATTVQVLVLQGMAGVGKTRLAVHFAHQLVGTGHFPDLQFYADLRSNADQPPANPATVLGSFLRNLGVPGSQIPEDLDARAALYRDRLRDRKALILLDDSDDLDQVLPLIPSSPASLVVITSRRTLAIDGASILRLDVLSVAEAVELMAGIAGDERVRSDPASARLIAQRCGYLPLAITLAARRLQARSTWTLADVAARLVETDDRVGELNAGGRRLRAVFDFSYHALPEATRQVFRSIGTHPGTDFTRYSVAALAGVSPSAAGRHLEQLVDEHLLTDVTAERFRLHDLLRDYAATTAVEIDGADRVRVATQRLCQWYLHAVDRAREAMFPHFPDIDLSLEPLPDDLPEFADDDQAYRWLIDEYATVSAVVDVAFDIGLDAVAWQLPVALKHFFERSGQYDDWVAKGAIALAATRRAGDQRAEGIVLSFIGIAVGQLDRFDDAIRHLAMARDLLHDAGDCSGETKAINNLGIAYRNSGNLTAAAEQLATALTFSEHLGDHFLTTRIKSNLGSTYTRLGEYEKALPILRQVYVSSQDSDDNVGMLGAVQNIGEALVALKQYDEAIPYLQDAVRMYRQMHFRKYEIEALEMLAVALGNVGEYDESSVCRERAAVLTAEMEGSATA